jgi:hypothetical protein
MPLRQLRTLILMLAVTLLGVSCGKSGNEYLGKWQNINNKNDKFEIVRNGDNFLLTKTSAGFFGKPQTTTVSCVLKDGILESKGGLVTATLTYVKATDRLTTPAMLGGSVEYERVK